ncbi:Mu-like prophage major head subunit gpT [Mesorhizobium albiziae]|uniref:Mu-like prophage major head subunit gpT n=1 Tax=Neomesorhizobium albiziae TaxID=335020 RepID=A0A1I3YEE0_9HYPH|nr:Mu-like prophage major head subunit gpT family protein [Mesorhizobium albiziae]GLS29951.1 hypothetical protein GCM10007937_16590 [Mesorhizobium albiziae]SFK29546.1 Mu-like prophage major head subunit gpT [Mesorhizobium albiziae]
MKKLLKKLRDLETRAAAKLAEIKDDTTDEAARSIEAEHQAILTEITATRAAIDAMADEDDTDPATTPAPAAGDAARAADIMALGRDAEMDAGDIEQAVRNGTSVEEFRSRAWDQMVSRSRQVRTEPGRVIRDQAETRRAGIVAALAFRLGGEAPTGDRAEMARGFMEFRDAVEFAGAAIDYRGAIRTVREREEVLSRAFHTASDFPAIFSDAINVTLERRYALANPTYRQVSRRRDFMDFRPHTAVGIGEFPMLEKLTEAGEIKFGTFGEGKEQIAVVPYAKGLRISRQMLVNDRLGAIADIFGGYGRTVSRFEEITFYAMMLSANTKLADGKVVFHVDHANLAGAGAAISVASIGAGQAAMRKQKGLDGATLNVTPSILLVSPDKETEALQYVAPIAANDSVKVNPFVGTLTPVVAAELSGNGWYLFANPEDAAVYQWGYLDGYSAPRVRFDEPFGTQGIGMTVEHDFGVGAIDYRGGYKNPGA